MSFAVRRVSTSKVRPENHTSHTRIDLNPWDLKPLGYQYLQKGLLFTKLQPMQKQEEETNNNVIDNLKTSLSCALNHFFPLAGRLGAEFIHASAEISVEDILSPAYVPQTIIDPLFSLNGVLNYEGHSKPLLSIQVTELLDGVFIGCSANHSVCDGTSFWQFINTWSEICRSSDKHTPDHPPVFERWFMNNTDRPLRNVFVSLKQMLQN
ncbi:hypothetical protein MKW94_000410 [Papaver nudicaule]|uniref:Uncharacterized protein n=1 Tax=Papaver nudicaule TaxID=74823 RepID=A0AA42B4G3_PAPNU|nr:hypothetical protein [Papaver nudicaule]